MKLLLDTHAFLWWVNDDPRLSKNARRSIGDRGNEIFFSAASGWEIAIKAGLGRLRLSDKPIKFIPTQIALNYIQVLPIGLKHALFVHDLPDHHSDPFDRILIAQSMLEELPLITTDSSFNKYAVDTVW